MIFIGELNPGEFYFSNDAGEECYAVVQDGEILIESYDGELSEEEVEELKTSLTNWLEFTEHFQ